jgi:hypothetical protein
VLKDKHGLLVHHFAKGNGNVFNRQLWNLNMGHDKLWKLYNNLMRRYKKHVSGTIYISFAIK